MLTIPQFKALQDEYARWIDPAREFVVEGQSLELPIHDLGNEA